MFTIAKKLKIEESYVYGVLNNLKTNKAIGLEKISARLLRDSSSVTTPIITKRFNRSLTSSTFPSTWKSGNVTALFKSGDQSNASNYRPITILPNIIYIISKVLEKAVHSQVYRYLIDNSELKQATFLTTRTLTGSKFDIINQSKFLTQSFNVTHAVRVVKNVACLSSLIKY